MIEEPLHLDQEEFDELVADVLDGLPEEWAPLIDSMTVVVEDEPDEEDIPADGDAADVPLGSYRGSISPVQLIGGGLTGPAATAPPEIVLYQGPLERASSSRDELRARVHDTLVEQVGHHFGYAPEPADDDDEGPGADED
jgi:predicted Zn-dependent protease with MMP-like domain